MGADTKIEWAHHTFNPWIGCTKVSPACDNCYAEAYAKRYAIVEWGPKGERKRTSADNWKKPLGWNGRAKSKGERQRVFCASLADVFDNHVPAQWRRDLFALINLTPHLDWLLLTKRPQNIAKMVAEAIDCMSPAWPWPNVWLGTTVENQEEADRRIPHLLGVPARVHFLSCEPLLGPVDLQKWLQRSHDLNGGVPLDDKIGHQGGENCKDVSCSVDLPDSDRLPAVPFSSLVIPPNMSAESGGEPIHDSRCGAINRYPDAKGTSSPTSPIDIALAVEESSDVSEYCSVVGDGNGLSEQLAGLPDRDASLNKSTRNGASTRADARTDALDGFASRVSVNDSRQPVLVSQGHAAKPSIAWVIVGGESGPHARPMHPDWARSLRDQCAAAGVAFHFKQWGEWHPNDHAIVGDTGHTKRGKVRSGRALDGRHHDEFPA